jgi:hypothetical protein
VRALGVLWAFAPAAAVLASWVRGGCGPGNEVSLTARLPADVAIAPGDIQVEPARSVHSSRLWGASRVTLLASDSASRLLLRVPGVCPVELPVGSDAREVEGRPWVDLGGDRAQIGFDTAFEVDVAAGCAEAERGEIVWRQLEGPRLLDLRVDARGFRLRARTRTLAELHPDPLRWGVVPMSPRTQGRYVLEATWLGPGADARRTIVITSIARATGVPSIAVGQRVLLGGAGWHVQRAPSRGQAEVSFEGGAAAFAPDVAGHWQLEDASGRGLQVSASRHDRMALDCARAECHPSEVEAATTSPMTHALERFLGEGPPAVDTSCMLDCHVAGERGLDDGGFLDLARTLPYRVARPSWRELPRALRRVGGVTCTGCHGPATIPEPDARWSVLSADVCATCHDSPPSYVHVEQWRASRMARSDERPAVRGDPACSRCHTTAGFLSAIGVRKSTDAAGPDASLGVACAACHAPHGAHAGEALVRAVPIPKEPGAEPWVASHPTSGVCVACHEPGPSETMPAASGAVLLLGRAAMPDGSVVSGRAPHDAVDGGCVGCHGGARPTDHSFRVDARRCSPCHPTEPHEALDANGLTIQARARALWGQLTADPLPAGTLHASAARLPTGPSRRALYAIALVLEDPAAGVHNAAFARLLLDDAERAAHAAR